MKKRLIALSLLPVGLLTMSLTGCAPTSPDRPCTVDEKDHSINKDGDGVYRVYTDCGVFNVEDAPFLGQFNSADTYARIKVGKTYEFVTYGYRNGLMSMFPNITKATEVK